MVLKDKQYFYAKSSKVGKSPKLFQTKVSEKRASSKGQKIGHKDMSDDVL